MNLVKHKNLFFLISGLVIVPGLISLILFGLKPGIDFTGGSIFEFSVKNPNKNVIEKVLQQEKVKVHSIDIKDKNVIIKSDPINQKLKNKIVSDLSSKKIKVQEKSFQIIGPSIGRETEINAFKAVVIASLAIMAYIAFAFRKVSKPVASWKYGVCAIAALLHDVLIVVGIFSILGYFFHVEVDALFITALLTVMGFSVHDTIVVFDRIRENLSKNFSKSYDEVVNDSLLETLNRSVNTSFTVLLVLFALLLFGGESIRWFVFALLVGIISGTYSSIFNASQLLVVWHNFDKGRRGKK